jgi:hypothetical protein
VIELAVVAPLLDIGRSLREASLMFWETLWALVLGFSFSGAVQAYVSRDQMQAKLGDHHASTVGRAAGYGVVSSSCSYAASAISKSLFAKGADFVAALVFMVASTNLVVELGIVMLVLLGWQFMVAEFIGGPIMIVLLALAGGFVLRGPLIAAARRRLVGRMAGDRDEATTVRVADETGDDPDRSTWSAKLRSPAALSDAAGYAVADVSMLRRELVIGYTAAGLLAVLVPTQAWNALFLQGHGFGTIVENAFVGPVIAVASCVCSIGNVPLAAALWFGGISFGGVISFIFADLIAMPLILIYRKFYGMKLTLRVVGLLYAVMVVAGLATEGIFTLLGAVPTTRAIHGTSAHFTWNYTAYLNVVFIALAAGVWWLARNRARLGGGRGYAIDPVCGMQVRTSDAPAQASFGGRNFSFCSDRCRERFADSPQRYVGSGRRHEALALTRVTAGQQIGEPLGARHGGAVDPICKRVVVPATAPAHRVRDGVDYWFCSPGCVAEFDAKGRSDTAGRTSPTEDPR